jgi:prepilin-type N-terminal cleavage/methylation domain-containing protein
MYHLRQQQTNRLAALKAPGGGFTLIELLITIVIISILASLSLAGMTGARQRSKIDKTKSTIRKLHEIVMPQYESYLSRRVLLPSGINDRISIAKARLTRVRSLMVQELPDQWSDVGTAIATLPPAATATRYANYMSRVSPVPGTSIYGGAECLYMIVTRGGFAADALELFRNDEVSDINKNNAPEFNDGWGRPIAFIRWPSGYSSVIQQQDFNVNPDPFDPMKVSGTGPTDLDYGLTPLIFSAGPDESTNDPTSGGNGYGIKTYGPWLKATWSNDLLTTRQGSPFPGTRTTDDADKDNITNHDLIAK